MYANLQHQHQQQQQGSYGNLKRPFEEVQLRQQAAMQHMQAQFQRHEEFNVPVYKPQGPSGHSGEFDIVFQQDPSFPPQQQQQQHAYQRYVSDSPYCSGEFTPCGSNTPYGSGEFEPCAAPGEFALPAPVCALGEPLNQLYQASLPQQMSYEQVNAPPATVEISWSGEFAREEISWSAESSVMPPMSQPMASHPQQQQMCEIPFHSQMPAYDCPEAHSFPSNPIYIQQQQLQQQQQQQQCQQQPSEVGSSLFQANSLFTSEKEEALLIGSSLLGGEDTTCNSGLNISGLNIGAAPFQPVVQDEKELGGMQLGGEAEWQLCNVREFEFEGSLEDYEELESLEAAVLAKCQERRENSDDEMSKDPDSSYGSLEPGDDSSEDNDDTFNDDFNGDFDFSLTLDFEAKEMHSLRLHNGLVGEELAEMC